MFSVVGAEGLLLRSNSVVKFLSTTDVSANRFRFQGRDKNAAFPTDWNQSWSEKDFLAEHLWYVQANSLRCNRWRVSQLWRIFYTA